jgi:hypothetical protein
MASAFWGEVRNSGFVCRGAISIPILWRRCAMCTGFGITYGKSALVEAQHEPPRLVVVWTKRPESDRVGETSRLG